MAFDPNSIPKDLRPINIARNIVEDPRVVPMSSPLGGYSNLAPGTQGWSYVVTNGAGNVLPSAGIRSNPSLGVRAGGSASSQASDECGDDSVSGKKVKFLCSFGGKIMPRPSDGMLRYVGGLTKIISVRKDVSFPELVQKMMGTYGQNVIIKYQLPDEDLDSLVSVSCPEDLENMMDEYEKLVERSEGSAKLRVFLFNPSDIDCSGMGHFGLQDNGQRYVEAVNGVADLAISGSGLKRKESLASLTSTQNSDFSGTEGIDFSTANQGDIMGLPLSTNLSSPKANSATPQDPSPRAIPIDTRIIVDTETPSAQLGVPLVTPHPIMPTHSVVLSHPTVLPHHTENEYERPIPVNIQNSSPYYQTFIDPNQQPQMGFPSQVMGPMYTHAQFHDNASGVVPTQQYIPPIHMTMAPPPPSHVSMRPNMVLPMMQQQDQFGPRIIQLPNGQSYHAYPAQIRPSIGGPYGFHQVTNPEQIVFSEGWVPQQQAIVHEEVQRFKDCDLCEKSLPHAHSDTVVQGPRASATNPPIDSTSVYHSLRIDDKTRALPVSSVVEQQKILGYIGNETGKTHQFDNDMVNLQTVENIDSSKLAALPVRVPPTFEMLPGIRPQIIQENVLQQQQVPANYQYKQQITTNTPVNNDIHLVNESPKGYIGNFLATAPKEVAVDSYDHAREIPRVSPPENKPLVESTIIKPKIDFDLNYLQSNELPPSTRPVEYSEMSKPPLLGNATQYPQPVLDINHLVPDEGSYNNFPFPVLNSTQIAEQVQPVDWSVDPSQVQPSLLPKDANIAVSSGYMLASVSPIKNVADVLESSNSLFSNQDPWDLQHDTHFPPPLPNKIAIRKEAVGTRAPFNETQFCDFGEIAKGNAMELSKELRLDEVDFGSGHTRTTQGSAEEQIKRDLQGVAEGVAASVLKSSSPSPSDPDLTKLERSEKVSEAIRNKNVRNDIETNKARNEETKNKLPEKANLGFPVSDGLGSLQVITNSDLEELRELGSGTFGTVYHGKWRGTDVAIKRINERCFAGKPSEIERMRDDFWNEAIKLADLHHPNVVAFYGVVLDGPGGSVATVTEYMVNGSLRTALQKNERNLDKRKRLLIAMDVAFGMEYLHGKNIVHFDLKSDNLLVNLRDPHRPICKVGDLGLSKVKCQTLISGGVRGTLPWMAPELLNGSSSLVSEKVDVFSYGIVMWELITGEEPYADLHYGAIIGGIVSNTLRPPVPETCDPEWRALMERCWSAEPSERPNFTEVANELRAMAAKIQTKAQNQQQTTTTQPQTKS